MLLRATLLSFALFLSLACGGNEQVVTCSELCQRGLVCLTGSVAQLGDSTSLLEADEARLMAACTSSCGGIWEEAAVVGSCHPDNTCGELSGCFPLPEEAPRSSTEETATSSLFTWHPERQCRAQVAGLEGCEGLSTEDERWECRIAVQCTIALRSGNTSGCRELGSPYDGLCEALGMRQSDSCPAADPRLYGACMEFLEGTPSTAHALLFAAIAEGRPALCRRLHDRLEARRCEALVSGNPMLCPYDLAVDDAWGRLFGASIQRPSRAQESPGIPLFLPGIYAILGILAVLMWPWLLVWGHHLSGRFRGMGRAGGVMLGVAIALYAAMRLWAVEGPINFVEYERVFVPGSDDLGRLGYAGWSLILRPLLLLLHGGYALLFATNAGFGLLGIVAIASLALRVSRSGEVAGMAALILASQPAFVRVGASASETLPFASLTIIFFDLLTGFGGLSKRMLLGVGLLLPLLLVMRPEGVMLCVPCLVALLLSPGGVRSQWRSWSAMQRSVALWIALLFVGAGALYVTLPRPPSALGLFFSNLQAVLADLYSPRFVSPVLLLAGMGATCWLLLVRRGRSLGGAMLVWSILLVVVWGVQGSEGNLSLGATRYVVLWLPSLALALALGIGRLKRQWWRLLAVSVCLAASVPQLGLVRDRSNLQIEYDFFAKVLPGVPPGSLLVLATTVDSSQEYSPEAAPMAILGMARQSASWVSVEEAVNSPPLDSGAYLLRGYYGNGTVLERLSACVPEALEEESVASNPDVGIHAQPSKGDEIVLGLYRLKCSSL